MPDLFLATVSSHARNDKGVVRQKVCEAVGRDKVPKDETALAVPRQGHHRDLSVLDHVPPRNVRRPLRIELLQVDALLLKGIPLDTACPSNLGPPTRFHFLLAGDFWDRSFHAHRQGPLMFILIACQPQALAPGGAPQNLVHLRFLSLCDREEAIADVGPVLDSGNVVALHGKWFACI